jgi:hypothetical protein
MMFRNTDGVVVRRNAQALEPGGDTVLISAPGSTRVERSRQPTLHRERPVHSPLLRYALGTAVAAIVLVLLQIRALSAPRSERRRLL